MDTCPSITAEILQQVEIFEILTLRTKMKLPPNTCNMSKYCAFHEDHVHEIDQCIELKKEIEHAIRSGLLKEFWTSVPLEKVKAKGGIWLGTKSSTTIGMVVNMQENVKLKIM